MKKNKHGIPERFVGLAADAVLFARTSVRKYTQMPPTALVLGYRDGQLGIILVGGMFIDDDDKNKFAETVRQACSKYKALGVIFMSEAWTAETKNREEYDEIKRRYGEIANYPGRKEVVHFHIETREGNWQGLASIKPGRKLGRFEFMQADGVEGRFSHFLPVIYATPEQVTAYIEMARQRLKAAGMDGDLVIVKDSILTMIERMARQVPVENLTVERIDQFISLLKPVHDAFYKTMGGR